MTDLDIIELAALRTRDELGDLHSPSEYWHHFADNIRKLKLDRERWQEEAKP